MGTLYTFGCSYTAPYRKSPKNTEPSELSLYDSYYDYRNPKSLLKTYIKDDFNDHFLDRRKMGFVFDVEAYIYKNYDKLFNEIPEVENLGINKKNIRKLRTIKSRVNANRLWKILFLENYIKSTKELISH